MPEKEVSRMNWGSVRQILKESEKTRGGEPNPQEKSLREYFGEDRFRMLRDLSQRSEEIREQLGNVILLPGIMGSHLSVIDANGKERQIWFNLWSIVKGEIKRLRLKNDGKTNVNGEKVKATGLIGWYYALALETLQAEPFPYDWRLSISGTASQLARFIEKKIDDGQFEKDREIHFVAHSMGGLVVRSFIAQHNELWNEIKGRLVMLGTPNYGSFAAIQGLMGKNPSVKKLALADICQNKAELSQIINTFLGLYQLCPSKSEKPNIYEKDFWKNFPNVWFDDYLQNVPGFYQGLANAQSATIDKSRMSYIAGTGIRTPMALKQLESGSFDFEEESDGDGTVPHSLGLLEGVPTYYVEESHGDLPNNQKVLRAVKEILQTGSTTVLPTVKPEVTLDRALITDSAIEKDLERVKSVSRLIKDDQNPEDLIVFDAEKKLLRSLIGGNLDRDDEPLSFLDDETEEERKTKKIKVDLVRGYIENADAPVVVVGQYLNLPPTGSLAAIDRNLNYRITYAYQNEMIGAELGQIFVVPQNGKPLNKNVKTVIVAGMGEYNRFSRDDLRYLVMNAALAVINMGYKRFATVLIGTGANLLSVERSVRSILAGVGDALERIDEKLKQKFERSPNRFTVVLIENRDERYKDISDALEKIQTNEITHKKTIGAKKQFIKGLDVVVDRSRSKLKSPKEKERPSFAPSKDQKDVTRITIERGPGLFCLSALTSNATIPKREIQVQDFVIDSLINKLRTSRDLKKQEKYGRLLHAILIPEDFQRFLDTNRSLVLILNRAAASVPWEMMGYGGKRGTTNFGVDLCVTRQFSSLSAPVPSVAPPINKVFKALVIADPAKDISLQLPGARKEGEALRDLFISLREKLKEEKIDFQFETRIGYQQCDIVEILSLIFDEEFDLIHFAGHGIFTEKSLASEKDKNNTPSGWVFGKDEITGNLEVLSAQEIFRLRRVPRLVFSNACFSSQIGAVTGNTVFKTEDNQMSAGLAEAFFLRGIENYIGAGWQVDDNYAIEFSKVFYQQALVSKKTLGIALSEARKSISNPEDSKDSKDIDSTWGAYQHYGNSNEMLVEKKSGN